MSLNELIDPTKAIDFDTAIQLYLNIEPSVAGLITLVSFNMHQKHYIKSMQLMDDASRLLKPLGLKPKLYLIWFHILAFYSSLVFGNLAYIYISLSKGRSLAMIVYDYMTNGISFHAQTTILLQLGFYIGIALEVFQLLNQHIKRLERSPFTNITNALRELRIVGDIHMKICESVNAMATVCTATLLVYTLKSYVEFSGLLLSLNGVLPAITFQFLLLGFCYLTGGIELTISSEMMNNSVSKQASPKDMVHSKLKWSSQLSPVFRKMP